MLLVRVFVLLFGGKKKEQNTHQHIMKSSFRIKAKSSSLALTPF
jgi:hypothetical protein